MDSTTSQIGKQERPSEYSVFQQKHFLTESDVYQNFIDLIVQETGSEIGYFHKVNEAAGEIEMAVWSSAVLEHCSSNHITHYPIKEAGIWADSIRQRQTVVHNLYQDVASQDGLPDGHFPVHRHMSTPIWRDDQIIGIVGVGNKPTPYSERESTGYAEVVGKCWGVAEDRVAHLRTRLSNQTTTFEQRSPEDVLSEMLAAVGKALEIRDEYTSHHQSNVAYIADAIAGEMKLPEGQRFGLRLGAMIHDIGKIGIPSALLNKPGKLHPPEMAVIKMHSAIGASIFDHMDLPWPIKEMIAQHHERMDGSGYPGGLIGEHICLEARIIAVADTFDAMASERPYRHAPGKAAAIETIQKGRGTAFDPYVVDAFLRCVETNERMKSETWH